MTQENPTSESSFEVREQAIEQAISRVQNVLAGLKKKALEQCPASDWLVMPIDQMSRKSPLQLAEAGVALAQYAAEIQKMLNAATAQRNALMNHLDDVAAYLLPETDPNLGWNNRLLYAKTQDPLCKKIQASIRACSIVVDSLAYMPSEIHRVAQAIHNLKLTHLATERAYERQS